MTDRFVVCGLAPPRSEWFRRLSQWAMTGAVPIEFHKCQSAEELLVRLDAPRPISAVLVDAASPGLDRDLLRGGAQRTPVLVVTNTGSSSTRDWIALGAVGQLDGGFEPSEVIDALTAIATRIARASDVPGDPAREGVRARGPAGLLVAVTGTGGSGVSTLAAALAQGIASARHHRRDPRPLPRPVVLADLALRADQAMLHDAADPLVTVQELVDICRAAPIDADTVRRHCAHGGRARATSCCSASDGLEGMGRPATSSGRCRGRWALLGLRHGRRRHHRRLRR